ncbi:ornithine decarboxylase-like isoform 1-T1 [Megaptera novaeangliae]
MSFHVGSRCKTPHSFTQAITNCRCMFEMGCGVSHDMSLLDIGGGFPGEKGSDSKFEEEDTGSCCSISATATTAHLHFPREPEPRMPIVVKEPAGDCTVG